MNKSGNVLKYSLVILIVIGIAASGWIFYTNNPEVINSILNPSGGDGTLQILATGSYSEEGVQKQVYFDWQNGKMIITQGPPLDEYSSIIITFSKMSIHWTPLGEENETTGNYTLAQDNNATDPWIDITLDTTQLDLVNVSDSSQLLGSTTLPEGRYVEIMIYIDSATATKGDETKDLTVPSDVLKVTITKGGLVIKAGETSTLLLDLDVRINWITGYLLPAVTATPQG